MVGAVGVVCKLGVVTVAAETGEVDAGGVSDIGGGDDVGEAGNRFGVMGVLCSLAARSTNS